MPRREDHQGQMRQPKRQATVSVEPDGMRRGAMRHPPNTAGDEQPDMLRVWPYRALAHTDTAGPPGDLPACPGGGRIEIRTLGYLRVLRINVHGERTLVPSVAWRHGRAKTLLMYLLSRPLPQATRDEAMEALWPDALPEMGSKHLSNALWHLRQALQPDDAQGGHPLYRNGRLFGLAAEACSKESDSPCWIDVLALERAYTTLRGAAGEEERLGAATMIMQLYRGDFLTEAGEENWVLARRDRLRAQWIQAACMLSSLHAERGDRERAVDPLLTVLESLPALVDVAIKAMHLLADAGWLQQALALHDTVLRECRICGASYPAQLRQTALEIHALLEHGADVSASR